MFVTRSWVFRRLRVVAPIAVLCNDGRHSITTCCVAYISRISGWVKMVNTRVRNTCSDCYRRQLKVNQCKSNLTLNNDDGLKPVLYLIRSFPRPGVRFAGGGSEGLDPLASF